MDEVKCADGLTYRGRLAAGAVCHTTTRRLWMPSRCLCRAVITTRDLLEGSTGLPRQSGVNFFELGDRGSEFELVKVLSG